MQKYVIILIRLSYVLILVNLVFTARQATGKTICLEVKMAHMVKMADMSVKIAAHVFQMLNVEQVQLKKDNSFLRFVIVTDTNPEELVYPEGWYTANGSFRNKHMSSNGIYEEVPIVMSSGLRWWDAYSLDDD